MVHDIPSVNQAWQKRLEHRHPNTNAKLSLNFLTATEPPRSRQKVKDKISYYFQSQHQREAHRRALVNDDRCRVLHWSMTPLGRLPVPAREVLGLPDGRPCLLLPLGVHFPKPAER